MVTNPLLHNKSIHPSHCATLRVGWYSLSQCPCWGSVLCCSGCSAWLVSLWQSSMKGVCSGSKFSPSPESMGQSCSEPGSDCRAPGYPCSGRGNVCDYLLCKPPSWRRKKRGGGMDGKDSFDRDCVFVCTLAGGIMCMQVCVCQRVLWLCVYRVFW